MGQLTDLKIRKLPPGTKEFHADGNNLFLRVQPSGHKSFVYRYQFGNKTYKITLGAYPTLSLAVARERAMELATLRLQHPDLVGKLRADSEAEQARRHAEAVAIAAQQARLTVRQLFGRWKASHLITRADHGQGAERLFDADVFPQVGDVAIEEINRGIVADLCDRIKQRGSPVMARHLFGELRQMFGFAIKRGWTEVDPTSHLERGDFGSKRERDRVLSEAEVEQLFAALPSAGLDPQVPPLLRLLLATGCRIGEAVGAEWSEIDLGKGLWRIPASRTKNRRPHCIDLSPYVLRQLQQLKALPTASPRWMFPATFKTDAFLDPKAINKQLRDRQLTAGQLPMKNRTKLHTSALCLPGGLWTPHDLRRTAATLAASHGTDPHVVDKMLNHVEQNRLIRIYQWVSYEAEKRAGWMLLGTLMDRLDGQSQSFKRREAHEETSDLSRTNTGHYRVS